MLSLRIERRQQMTQSIRTYTELIQIPTFIERYRYLKLGGKIGEETYGWERYLNQNFYNSYEWRQFRRQIIIRDFGCDLGVEGHEFAPGEIIFIHHMNPINTQDIVNQTEFLMNPEYVISCRKRTHDAIHYGDESLITPYELTVRAPNDTCPWRN